jgi:hypothetical protein
MKYKAIDWDIQTKVYRNYIKLLVKKNSNVLKLEINRFNNKL